MHVGCGDGATVLRVALEGGVGERARCGERAHTFDGRNRHRRCYWRRTRSCMRYFETEHTGAGDVQQQRGRGGVAVGAHRVGAGEGDEVTDVQALLREARLELLDAVGGAGKFGGEVGVGAAGVESADLHRVCASTHLGQAVRRGERDHVRQREARGSCAVE